MAFVPLDFSSVGLLTTCTHNKEKEFNFKSSASSVSAAVLDNLGTDVEKNTKVREQIKRKLNFNIKVL